MNALHIVIAMKPIDDSNAENAIERGVCGLNIDGTRIETRDGKPAYSYPKGPGGIWSHDYQQEHQDTAVGMTRTVTVADNEPSEGNSLGRWPANIMHDGSDDVVAQFPSVDSPNSYVKSTSTSNKIAFGKGIGQQEGEVSMGYGDSGSAARFFKECKE